MANVDLKTFLENRLVAMDPAVDISDGSPAQVKFIEPVLTYLGTDPFETDIGTFLLDRFAQEFPGTYAAEPGVVNDILVKPLIILLEPFKREIQAIRRNQSVSDPSVISDEDADALAANFFVSRPAGTYATVVARMLYQNPTNVTVDLSNRFYTSGGLSFFPINPFTVTAEEMVFNRSGSLYYVDVPCRAEGTGTSYKIPAEAIVGVDGMSGVVRVTNPRESSSAKDYVDTPTFLAATEQSLTERSLTNRRGATARILDVFSGQVSAVQVIGANDPEMQRDILVATSPGHAWLTGRVSLYGKVALVQCRTLDAQSTLPSVSEGDTLYVYLHRAGWPSIPQASRFVRLLVEEVLSGPTELPSSGSGDMFQVAYFLRWSGSFPDQVEVADGTTLEGGLSKKGTVRVSSLPGDSAGEFDVGNGEVHVLGHTDIYVRPTEVTTAKAVIDSMVDDKSAGGFLVQRIGLSTSQGSNSVTDPSNSGSFSGLGIVPGDILSIENGDDAGVYRIAKVTPGELYLAQDMTKTSSGLRYSVSRMVNVNPFEPRNLKLPFGDVTTNDLVTTLGSPVFTLRVNDAIDYGVKAGDTLRILSGDIAGDYTVTGFDGSGHRVIVDRQAAGTYTSLQYEVFTGYNKVSLPLTRIKQLLLLDSTKQSTGVTIPPAEPIGNIPVSSFTSAQVRGKSRYRSGFVLPAMLGYITNPNTNESAPEFNVGNRRYTDGYEYADDGVYKPVKYTDGNYVEFLYPRDAMDKCCYFLATTEDFNGKVNYPPIDPKPGEALTIKSGPNKGSYTIKNVRKFKYAHATESEVLDAWVYLIQIHGSFPVDAFRSLISFLDSNGRHVTKIGEPGSPDVEFPTFYTNFYQGIGAELDAALGYASPGPDALQIMAESVLSSDYEWGDPARGVVRTYFQEPTLFQENTGDSDIPTTFSYTTDGGEVLKFRPDPNRYVGHNIVPARLSSDVSAKEYPRDAVKVSSGTARFTDSVRAPMFSLGVVEGDVLEIHPEFLTHGSTGDLDRQTAIKTTAGSAVVTTDVGNVQDVVFDSSYIGDYLFIDEGQDSGEYKIVDVRGPHTLVLDHPMTRSTPTVLASGTAHWGNYGVDANKVMVLTGTVPANLDSKYVTIYGMNTEYQGSYKILSGDSFGFVIEKSQNFPDFSIGEASKMTCCWAVTAAPDSTPATARSGTELLLQPVRVYDDTAVQLQVSSVPTSVTVSEVSVSGTIPDGVKQPYRIFRKNIRRVNPTEMSLSRDGPYYYADTDVVSMSPNPANNIPNGSYLVADSETYKSYGYTFLVKDRSLSYSSDESGYLVISPSILPPNVEDSPENEIQLSGSPVQVVYAYGDVVSQVQDFVSSPLDRTGAANILVRGFLPSVVSFWASYSGGSSTTVVAKDIIGYVNNLPIETPVDVSVIQGLIEKRGGNPDTPVKVFSLVYGWDRKAWLEVNENELGGVLTKVPFDGTTRVLFFSSGEDLSGQDPVPDGESINLARR